MYNIATTILLRTAILIDRKMDCST